MPMFDVRDFDELNLLVVNKRSEPFSDYFGRMDLTKEQKEERKKLAERLNAEFIGVIALLFYMSQYSYFDWNLVRKKFQDAYLDALKGVIDVDDNYKMYILKLSMEMVETTKEHLKEPYYFSADRSAVYAEEESNTAWNNADFIKAVKNGKKKKRWLDMRDSRERETHLEVGGRVLPIGEPFVVGNSLMMYPKDFSMDAEAKEIVNCRCSIKYF